MANKIVTLINHLTIGSHRYALEYSDLIKEPDTFSTYVESERILAEIGPPIFGVKYELLEQNRINYLCGYGMGVIHLKRLSDGKLFWMDTNGIELIEEGK